MPTSYTITLGKDVALTGISNARSCTVTSSASEIDITSLDGSSYRKFKKGLAEQTAEFECTDNPGCESGATITIVGTNTGNTSYIVTSVVRSEPLDGIVTYTVSATRAPSA